MVGLVQGRCLGALGFYRMMPGNRSALSGRQPSKFPSFIVFHDDGVVSKGLAVIFSNSPFWYEWVPENAGYYKYSVTPYRKEMKLVSPDHVRGSSRTRASYPRFPVLPGYGVDRERTQKDLKFFS